MTSWHIVSDGGRSQPLTVAEVVAELLRAGDQLLWVESDGHSGTFAYELPEVRDALFALHLRAVAGMWFERRGSPPPWVRLLVIDTCERHSSRAVPLVQALVAEARDDEELALVGAGPLEDALCHQGPAIIRQIEEAAATDRRFRIALAGVWKSTMADEVWSQVSKTLAEQQRY